VVRIPSRRLAFSVSGLIVLLIAEGLAVTHSYLWAAPLVAVIFVASAVEIPVQPFLYGVLLIRVLTDASLSSSTIRSSGSLNLSAGIALLFILMAAGLSIRRHGLRRLPAAAVLWICFWTGVAVTTHGSSTETVREGVREVSIVAMGLIAYNARDFTVSKATRLIQLVGLVPALLALYQLATHSGLEINGQIRSNGTFTHPNSAVMFFAVAATASLWRYLDDGRRKSDAALGVIFAGGALATFSLSGLAALVAMLVAYGTMRRGSFRLKLAAYLASALIVIGFVATPLGSERISNEASTSLASSETRGTANTSLASRFYIWQTLLPEWERSPILGQGLGTTVTVEGTSENNAAGKVPHNEYLRYLVETGVVGLAILLAGIIILVRVLKRQRHSYGTLGVALVVGCLVNGLVDNTILFTTTGYGVALLIGAILASTRREARSRLHSSAEASKEGVVGGPRSRL
jgi:O-antigen ligase